MKTHMCREAHVRFCCDGFSIFLGKYVREMNTE